VGLGLYTAKMIIEQKMGGKLRFRTNRSGSLFSIDLGAS
jgi:signal transduction histidine kinase